MGHHKTSRKFDSSVRQNFTEALRRGDWDTVHALSVDGGRHDGRRALLRNLADQVLKEVGGFPVPEVGLPETPPTQPVASVMVAETASVLALPLSTDL